MIVITPIRVCVCLSLWKVSFLAKSRGQPSVKDTTHLREYTQQCVVKFSVTYHSSPGLIPRECHTQMQHAETCQQPRDVLHLLWLVCVSFIFKCGKSLKRKRKERSVAALLICSAVAQRRERHLGNSPLFGSCCWLATLVVDLIQLIY